MKEETTLIYHCEYCNEISLQKSTMLQHESTCGENPDNIPKCDYCPFYVEMDDLEEYFMSINQEVIRSEGRYGRIRYCLKQDKIMILPQNYNTSYGKALNGGNFKKMPTLREGCSNYETEITSEQAHLQYGDAIRQKGEYHRAIDFYIASIAQHRYFYALYDACAELYELLNDRESAKGMKARKKEAEDLPF